MGDSSIMRAAAVLGALLLATGLCDRAWAEQPEDSHSSGQQSNVYQRHAYASSPMRGGWQDFRQSQFTPPSGPQINAGTFQRPYPYHLDYYRMRYGGSYAPYFGNLYGPPQVVTAPPYYGPYYGGYGYGQPAGYGFQGDAFQGGSGAAAVLCPCAPNALAGDGGAATASNANASSEPINSGADTADTAR